MTKIAISVFVSAMFASPPTFAEFPDKITKSRWAMDDPIYAEKYADGASKTDIVGKVKQASDARFVKDKFGWYGSAGFSSFGDSEPMGSLELGATGYSKSYLTNRVGLIIAANDEDKWLGGECGIRFQTPTRLAPFMGAGLFAGYARNLQPAENDHIDNDDDGATDERGEKDEKFGRLMMAIYPETGLHFWLSQRVRLTGFGRYLVTTEGRNNDDWYLGGSVAFFSRH